VDVAAPLQRGLAQLAATQDALQRRQDHLKQAIAGVDNALSTIDRDRDEVDAALAQVPPLTSRLGQLRLRPDVAAPAPLGDAPGWVQAEVSVDDVNFHAVLDATMNDPVTANLAAGRVSDHHLIGLMLQLVGPGDLVLDLGAHVGAFSLAAAARGCLVLAVEASASNAALLRASAMRNGFHELRIVNAAASDTAGTIEFEANGPWGHIAWDTDGVSGAGTIPVPAITVDELLQAFAWPAPTFVKMDVEGSELKAIEGMRRLLGKPDAPPVLFESNGHALGLAGEAPGALLRAFEDLGYVNYLVDPGRLTRLDAGQPQVETVSECLAVKRRPPGLSGWEVRPAVTMEDTLLRVVAESRHPNPDCRVYIARTLASFDTEFLTHPLVAGALEALRLDGLPEVRSAAAWSAPAGSEGLVAPAGQRS
jgi:FkbM family methyltransferase